MVKPTHIRQWWNLGQSCGHTGPQARKQHLTSASMHVLSLSYVTEVVNKRQICVGLFIPQRESGFNQKRHIFDLKGDSPKKSQTKGPRKGRASKGPGEIG